MNPNSIAPRADYENYTPLARWIVLAAVVLGAILEILDTTIVSTAIPQMQGNLGATLDEIGWVSTGYIVANVVILPLTGYLSGRFGRRKYLAASMAFFTFASMMCGFSASLWGLVFWRVMQGAGGAALISTAQATLISIFPPKQINMVQGIFGLAIMVAPTTGPTIGGYITDQFSWPWAFFVNLPLGILGVILVLTFLKDNPNQKAPAGIDLIGIGLLAVGLASLQTVLEKGNRESWFESPLVTGLSILAALSLGGFVWWEWRHPFPAVNLRILKNRAFAAGWAFNFAVGTGLYASVFIFPVFMQSLRGYTAQETGMMLIPRGLATACITIITIRLAGRIQPRVLIGFGCVFFISSMLYMHSITLLSGPDQMLWPMIIAGAGLGMLVVPTASATLGSLAPQEVPAGAGLFNLMRQLGGSVGIAASSTLIDHYSQQSRAALVEHINPFNPVFQQRLAQMTSFLQSQGDTAAVAQQRAMAMIDRMVAGQALLIAFEKVYFLLAMVFVLAFPLLLGFKKVKAAGGAGGAH